MTVDNYIAALETIRTGLENVKLALSEVIGGLKAEKFKAQREQQPTPASVGLIATKEISALNFTEKEIDKMPKQFKTLFKAGRIRATVRFRNNVYEIRCQVYYQKISASSKNLEIAKRKFIEKLNEVVLPNQGKKLSNVTFAAFADKWLEIKERTTKETTYNEYKRVIERDLKPYFRGKSLREITRENVQALLFSKVDAGKHRTAQKLQLVLKCIFDLAESDYQIPSPMSKIVLPHHEKERGAPFTLIEEQRLLDYCKLGGTASSALLVLLYFGLRRSELKTLRCSEDSLTVVTSKTRLGKNEVERTIPFTAVFNRVKRYVNFEEAKNTNVSTLYGTLKKLFPHKHPHELRYTFISRCKESGVNPEVVMLWAGHEEDKDVLTSRVNRRYTLFSQEFLQEEAKKVDYSLNFE